MPKPTASPGNGTGPWDFRLSKDVTVTDEYAPLLPEDERTAQLVHQRLIQEVDVKAVEKLGPDRSVEAVEMATRTLLAEVGPALYGDRKERVIRRIVADDHDPKVPPGQVRHARPGRDRDADADRGGLSPGRCAAPAQYCHLRRNRDREDDSSERAFGVYTGTRANHHD